MARGVVFRSRFLDRKIYRSLRLLREFGGNPAPLLENWGGILEKSTRRRFDEGRGPGGVPWPKSQRVLRSQGGSTKTLVDKGNLERSLRYEVRGNTRLLVGVDGNSESAKNAASHQFGVDANTVVVQHYRIVEKAFGVPLDIPRLVLVRGHPRHMRLPARPFLGVDNNDRRELRQEGQRYLRELLGR